MKRVVREAGPEASLPRVTVGGAGEVAGAAAAGGDV